MPKFQSFPLELRVPSDPCVSPLPSELESSLLRLERVALQAQLLAWRAPPCEMTEVQDLGERLAPAPRSERAAAVACPGSDNSDLAVA